MALVERFTPGGNLYPDGSSEFAMLVQAFRRIAENRDVQDQVTVENAAKHVKDSLDFGSLVSGRSATAEGGDTAWRQTTEDGHLLPLGYRSDGHLDDFARQIFKADIVGAEDIPTHPDYARIWTTDDGTNRLILGVRWDGTVEIPGLTGAPTPGTGSGAVYTDAPYTYGSDLLPVRTDATHWAIWGSSSSAGIAPHLQFLADSHGVTLTAGGQGSERAEHIAARIGSHPAMLIPADGSLTIPASGAVTVTSSSFTPASYLKAYTGTWAGVHGTLSSTATAMTFTRTTAGETVTLTGEAPMIPELGHAARDAVTLLWMGKNNTGTPGSAAHVIGLTDQAHDWLAPLQKRCLVLGHFVDTNQPAASTQRTNVTAINAAHAGRYGDAFLDVSGYLTGSQVWTDTGITPTQTDLDQQALGNKPPSLSVDNLHLNGPGYEAVRDLINDRMTTLGWI